jgi:hypothetical protein
MEGKFHSLVLSRMHKHAVLEEGFEKAACSHLMEVFEWHLTRLAAVVHYVIKDRAVIIGVFGKCNV